MGLKVWWYLASVAIGCVFGYIYLYTVYISRNRFEKHRGTVALLASAYMSFGSAYLFMIGMVSLRAAFKEIADGDLNQVLYHFFI